VKYEWTLTGIRAALRMKQGTVVHGWSSGGKHSKFHLRLFRNGAGANTRGCFGIWLNSAKGPDSSPSPTVVHSYKLKILDRHGYLLLLQVEENSAADVPEIAKDDSSRV